MEILGIGPGEFFLIMILLLIVVGPERLPEFARRAGKLLVNVRNWIQRSPDAAMVLRARQEIENELAQLRAGLAEMENARNEVLEAARNVNQTVKEDLVDELHDSIGQLRETVRQDVVEEVNKAVKEEVAEEVREQLAEQISDDIVDEVREQIVDDVAQDVREQVVEDLRAEVLQAPAGDLPEQVVQNGLETLRPAPPSNTVSRAVGRNGRLTVQPDAPRLDLPELPPKNDPSPSPVASPPAALPADDVAMLSAQVALLMDELRTMREAMQRHGLLGNAPLVEEDSHVEY